MNSSKKPFSNIIQKALLKISTNRAHKEYQKVKTLQLTEFTKVSLLIKIFSMTYFLIYFLLNQLYENAISYAIILLLCMLSWLFCQRLKRFVSNIFLLLSITFSIYACYLIQKVAQNSNGIPYGQVFLSGYTFGIYEKIICLRLSNFFHKISFLIISTLAKYFIIKDAQIAFQIYPIYIIIISLLIEYIKEKDDRTMFQDFHDEKENLDKFRHLVSSGLAVNVLILTKDLKEPLFISDPLDEMTKTQGALHWLDQLIIEKQTTRDQEDCEKNHSVLAVLKEMTNQKKLALNAKDQTDKIFEIKIFVTEWDDKDAFVLVFNDITEHYSSSNFQSLADQNKDRMLAMISHELRTPLNGILGVVNILKKDIKEPQQLRYLTVCHNSGELLLNLVNSILDLQQIRDKKFSLKFTKEDLVGLLGGIYDLFKFQFDQKNLYFKLEISSEVPEQVITDKNRLKQILINLIGNALKFTFKGGVTVLVDIDPVLQGYIHFRVTDTGIGIKGEDLKNLFKMYGRLEQEDAQTNTQGIGFGLEISNQLASLLAGADCETNGLQVESQVSQGTTFSFSIKDNSSNTSNSEESHMINYYEPKVYSENIEDIGIKMTPYLQKDIFVNNRVSPRDLSPSIEMPFISFFSQRLPCLFDSQSSPRKRLKNMNQNRSYNNLQRHRGTSSPMHLSRKDHSLSDFSHASPHYSSHFIGKKQRILIVDDNLFNLLVARHLVERFGYEVETALNGELAIEKTKNCLPLQFFSAVLMDLQMPVMDGYETTKKLRHMMNDKEIPEIPIIAISANDTEDDKKRCQAVGMYTHLSKPLCEGLLKKVLDEALEKE